MSVPLKRLSAAVFVAVLVGCTAPAPRPETEADDGSAAEDQISRLATGGFTFQQSVMVPGDPETAFDGFTRVQEWWDHTFSGDPGSLHLDARPGGGFWEIFDDEGNGVLHATVIAVHRGRLLRFDGPLGLSGNALKMVHTIEFEASGDSTRVTATVRGAGELQDGWPGAVERAWAHFLEERYRPFMEGRLQN